MRARTPAVLMLVCLAPLACSGPESDADADEGMEQIAPAPPPSEVSRTLTFDAVAPATASGSLIVTEKTDGSSTVKVDLMGLAPGDHAWHVHRAPCGTDGPIVLPFTDTAEMEGIADPLDADDDGHATAEVTIESNELSATQLRSGEYSIHVHEAAGAQPGASVACVTLR